jgi:hypothetical protein
MPLAVPIAARTRSTAELWASLNRIESEGSHRVAGRGILPGNCPPASQAVGHSVKVAHWGGWSLGDSFECAIQKLAPVCQHCGCKILGHGIEAKGTFFCCAHCAREAGVTAAVDHV